ncbi:hypothetical protein H0X06_06675 [Candidatus Dependentiae bacterium]|nr:hypothetical protein [Candidatus Dependentiae bacterium]
MFIKKNLVFLSPLLLISFSSVALSSSSAGTGLEISSSDKTSHCFVDNEKQEKTNSEAHYKALALQAEEYAQCFSPNELIKKFNNREEIPLQDLKFNEAFSILVKLLKETGAEHLSKHTSTHLDFVIPDQALMEPYFDFKKAKKEIETLIAPDVNTYAQAQGYLWLGESSYIGKHFSDNRGKSKKYFKKALSLDSNKRASAMASFILGTLYLEKNHSQKAQTKGLFYLDKARNQDDFVEMAFCAQIVLEEFHDKE